MNNEIIIIICEQHIQYIHLKMLSISFFIGSKRHILKFKLGFLYSVPSYTVFYKVSRNRYTAISRQYLNNPYSLSNMLFSQSITFKKCTLKCIANYAIFLTF